MNCILFEFLLNNKRYQNKKLTPMSRYDDGARDNSSKFDTPKLIFYPKHKGLAKAVLTCTHNQFLEQKIIHVIKKIQLIFFSFFFFLHPYNSLYIAWRGLHGHVFHNEMFSVMLFVHRQGFCYPKHFRSDQFISVGVTDRKIIFRFSIYLQFV